MVLVALPLLLHSARVLGGGEVGYLPLLLSMSVPWLLVTALGVSRAWAGARLRLVADAQGIALHRGSRVARVAWEEVEACREEGSPSERDGASWVTLRDRDDNLLLQWERSWFGHSKSSLLHFDRFTAFVQQQAALARAEPS